MTHLLKLYRARSSLRAFQSNRNRVIARVMLVAEIYRLPWQRNTTIRINTESACVRRAFYDRGGIVNRRVEIAISDPSPLYVMYYP